MITKRFSELNVLNEYGKQAGNQLVILYGVYGIGKTTLLNDFIKDYEEVKCFPCSVVSVREQLYMWANDAENFLPDLSEYPDMKEFFKELGKKYDHVGKKIIVFDEFQNLAKNSEEFIQALFSFLKKCKQSLMIILCSSTVEWIENSMIKKFGVNAKDITGFLKVKELSFHDFVNEFPQFTMEECINGYAIFGGIPAIWQQIDKTLSLKENIIQTVCNKNSLLYHFGMLTLERSLRETGVYNTILTALAGGKHKLNDLYQHTGFSRAKISVYIKNLMELDILEKDFSIDTEGWENVQKGLYGISNRYVEFTYKFLFPNLSLLDEMGAEWFYSKIIKPELKAYSQDTFAKICREYIENENKKGNLPFAVNMVGKWSGKMGNIDIVASDDQGNIIIGMCNWEKPMMRYDDYEWLMFCAEQAKIKANYVYLISQGGFDEKLHIAQKSHENIRLLTADKM